VSQASVFDRDQGGSINWFMGMADRNVGTGHVGLRGMISLEPWTIRGCGYPICWQAARRARERRFTTDSTRTISSWN
jgi:hypothetical protein